MPPPRDQRQKCHHIARVDGREGEGMTWVSTLRRVLSSHGVQLHSLGHVSEPLGLCPRPLSAWGALHTSHWLTLTLGTALDSRAQVRCPSVRSRRI